MLIVFVHVAGISMYRLGTDPDMSDYMLLFAVFETIAHNSTIFFALIAGLLYSTVLAGRRWCDFFRSKMLNVILPYLIFSLIFTAVAFDRFEGIVPSQGGFDSYVRHAFTNFSAGSASFQFWYIPVLAALFALTPLIVWSVAQPWGSWLLLAASGCDAGALIRQQNDAR